MDKKPSDGRKEFYGVNVPMTPTLLTPGRVRWSLQIYNNSSVGLWLGLSGTATQNRYYLGAAATLLDKDSADEWWGWSATGTANIRLLEVL
jgi:hypothetical protein